MDKKDLEEKVIKLPDGNEIKLDKEMSLCPEILFHLEMINKTVGIIEIFFDVLCLILIISWNKNLNGRI